MRWMIGLAALAAIGLGPVAGPAGATAAEPPGYRMGDYRAPTPATLSGAVTVDTPAAKALLDRGGAVPVFVVKLDRSTLPGAPWLVAKPEAQIPGSVWLPNVGLGALAPEMESYLRTNLERLTGGDRHRGLLFYCRSDCWMSWNAARRAMALGYRHVFWYRDGIDAWIDAGQPTETAAPVPVATGTGP